MHGRPRDYKNKLRDPKAQESYKKKVDAIRNGTALILQCRQLKRYDETVLSASAKLLKVVPEIYTIWNFRREALGEVLAAGGEAGKAASDGELALTQVCLLENPKSYSTWHHRKWTVGFGLCSLDAELAIISRALDEDPRNFHAWNYRQFLVKRMGRPLQDELQYSEDKIAQNFSNYSAWHYRTILLHQLHAAPPQPAASGQPQSPVTTTAAAPPGAAGAAEGAGEQATGGTQSAADAGGAAAEAGAGQAHVTASLPGLALGSASQTRPIPVEVLDEEYDMVHQAFATDSNDQSPWMYYRWLVGNSLAHVDHALRQATGQGVAEAAAGGEGLAGGGTAATGVEEAPEVKDAKAVLEAVLAREVSRMELDHLAAEPDSKWPLLTLARLKEAQVRLGLCAGQEEAQVRQEVQHVYERLMKLDPLRAGYYRDALEGKAFVVVSALGTV